MTVISTNISPGNDSKYARRRLIRKGKDKKLEKTIAELEATPGVIVYKFYDTPGAIHKELYFKWGLSLHMDRLMPKPGHALGSWHTYPPPQSMKISAGALESDLALIWKDFIVTTVRRIGTANGSGWDSGALERYTGKSLVLFAFGMDRFDIIVSKWGLGENLKKKHYFFQWQARLKKTKDIVGVDDLYGDGED